VLRKRAAELARVLQERAIPIGGGQERTVKELAELFVKAAAENSSAITGTPVPSTLA
jgi:hypothetical protein